MYLNVTGTLVLHTLTNLSAYLARPRLSRFKLLPEDGEVGLVSGQTQHDEVSVGPVETVVGVWVVVGLAPLTTNEIHDLVLTLTGDISVRQDDLYIVESLNIYYYGHKKGVNVEISQLLL